MANNRTGGIIVRNESERKTKLFHAKTRNMDERNG